MFEFSTLLTQICIKHAYYIQSRKNIVILMISNKTSSSNLIKYVTSSHNLGLIYGWEFFVFQHIFIYCLVIFFNIHIFLSFSFIAYVKSTGGMIFMNTFLLRAVTRHYFDKNKNLCSFWIRQLIYLFFVCCINHLFWSNRNDW